jgi:transposase
LAELKREFNVSIATLWKRLEKMKITLKKLTRYRENDKLDRWFFLRKIEEIKQHPQPTLYYIDESGIEH